jgi:hypothetical protein
LRIINPWTNDYIIPSTSSGICNQKQVGMQFVMAHFPHIVSKQAACNFPDVPDKVTRKSWAHDFDQIFSEIFEGIFYCLRIETLGKVRLTACCPLYLQDLPRRLSDTKCKKNVTCFWNEVTHAHIPQWHG